MKTKRTEPHPMRGLNSAVTRRDRVPTAKNQRKNGTNLTYHYLKRKKQKNSSLPIGKRSTIIVFPTPLKKIPQTEISPGKGNRRCQWSAGF